MIISYLKLILILLFISSSINAEENSVKNLKTLFTTPKERSALDDMRNAGKFNNDKKNSGSSFSLKLEPTKVELRGIMIREKGKPVVWVNNGNTLKSQIIDSEITIKTNAIKKQPVKIPVRVNQRTLIMKPGQQWDEVDNRITDKYQTR